MKHISLDKGTLSSNKALNNNEGKVGSLVHQIGNGVKNACILVLEPIAYEFRRLRELAEECRTDIWHSSLSNTEKTKLLAELEQALHWLKTAESNHYQHFQESLPVIDIRHRFEDRLTLLRSRCVRRAA